MRHQSIHGACYLHRGIGRSLLRKSATNLRCLDTLQLTGGPQPDEQTRSRSHNHLRVKVYGNPGVGESSIVNADMLTVIRDGALWSRTGIREWIHIGHRILRQELAR